tara:strand:- start:3939 stop:4604 length:666 start_codon:yes stop_codon:yes gene_type:complete
MSARIRYPRDKIKSSSSNNALKFILIISLISVIVVLAAELKIFFSPYVADSENVEEDVRGETNTGTVHSEKDIEEEIEFTFFDTLSKPEKYSSLDDQKKNIPEASLNKKKESSLKPQSSQSKEKKELKTQQSPVEPKYSVQMGSFKKKSRAESFAAMLNKKGYQVSIKSAEISSRGLWYRVFLKEGFPDRESALKLIRKIKDKDNISALLKSSSNPQTSGL